MVVSMLLVVVVMSFRSPYGQGPKTFHSELQNSSTWQHGTLEYHSDKETFNTVGGPEGGQTGNEVSMNEFHDVTTDQAVTGATVKKLLEVDDAVSWGSFRAR